MAAQPVNWSRTMITKVDVVVGIEDIGESITRSWAAGAATIFLLHRLHHFERSVAIWFPASRFQYHISVFSVSTVRKSVETRKFQLKDEHVRLCDLLKLVGIADSGGQGKQLVAAGAVVVDGHPESRKTAKIRAGQQVDCQGVRILVRAPE